MLGTSGCFHSSFKYVRVQNDEHNHLYLACVARTQNIETVKVNNSRCLPSLEKAGLGLGVKNTESSSYRKKMQDINSVAPRLIDNYGCRAAAEILEDYSSIHQ